MIEYIIFPTVQDAIARSMSGWLAVLGRAKRPEDGTDKLWSIMQHPQNGNAALIINSERNRLTPQEIAQLGSDLAGDGFIIEETM